MTTKNVTVVSVEKTTDTKHPRLVLHYVGTDGTTWKIGNLASKLDESSRTRLLAAKKDDVVAATIVKDGNYWTLTNVSEPMQSAEQKPKWVPKTTQTKTGGYDSLGNQIGNCITNAVNSLGVGKTTKEYRDRAVELLLMGDEIRSNAEAGNYKADRDGLTNPVVDLDDADVTDELGF